MRNDMKEKEFIIRIAPLAKKEMQQSGILASITIAQACLESGYGTSELAVNANNLFGMKSVLSGNSWRSVWDGVSNYNKRTQEQDKSRNAYYINASFRKYPDISVSIRDHSLYLLQAMDGSCLRYKGLSGEEDYRRAITIIKNGGYATDVKYVDKICQLIEKWKLYEYDKEEHKTMKVCLDAGHQGKYNQSPCNKIYYESDMVWKLHLLLKKYLESYGIDVAITRNTQAENKDLYSRGTSSAGCNLFISLHSNAVNAEINNTVDYPVSYCAINGAADGIGLALAQCVENVMGTSQKARIEHRNGSHGDYYGVIRGATAVGVPGLILEHSFHTNSRSTEWLLNDANLDKLAKAEADTIAVCYGIIKPVQPVEKEKKGWIQEDGGWRYYLSPEFCVCNDWYKDGDKWYWFNAAGIMVTDTWYMYKGDWYYMGSDGAMVKGLKEINGEYYYLDEDGKMATEPVLLTPDENGALQYPGLAK